MTSLWRNMLVRTAAALAGLGLLLPTLFVQVPLSEPGIDPAVLPALLLFAVPCGLLLYFARTGRWHWGSALFLPLLDLVQSAAVLASLALFPHTRAIHVTATVLASWLFVAGLHLVRSSHLARRPTA